VPPQERGHGDGVLHDLDSIEAIEEVFWRCFEGDQYISRDSLSPFQPGPDTILRFRDYVSLVRMRYERPRYLSKNNNNILRLPALVEAFPSGTLIHPFRHPARQAASLLAQHRRAVKLHAADAFRKRFMDWLGHHEFGGGQRPFRLSDRPLLHTDPSKLDYWLEAWSRVYGFLLDQPINVKRRQVFLDYDSICADPASGGAALARSAGIPTQSIDSARLVESRRAAPQSVLSDDTMSIYTSLQAQGRAFQIVTQTHRPE
jgi:hypothetical protein